MNLKLIDFIGNVQLSNMSDGSVSVESSKQAEAVQSLLTGYRGQVDALIPKALTLMKNQKKTVLFMVGPPCSGKSHVAGKIKTAMGRMAPNIISSDKIRDTNFKPPTYSKEESTMVFKLLYVQVEGRMRTGENIIVDSTGFYRNEIDVLSNRYNYNVVFFCFWPPFEVLLAQNPNNRPEDLLKIYREKISGGKYVYPPRSPSFKHVWMV